MRFVLIFILLLFVNTESRFIPKNIIKRILNNGHDNKNLKWINKVNKKNNDSNNKRKEKEP